MAEIPRYVVSDDELVNVATVGRQQWAGTTVVVLLSDHLAAINALTGEEDN